VTNGVPGTVGRASALQQCLDLDNGVLSVSPDGASGPVIGPMYPMRIVLSWAATKPGRPAVSAAATRRSKCTRADKKVRG